MLITIEILVAYNVNTVNTQPTQLIKSKASVNVSVANVSVTISFPEFFLRGGVSKCTPPTKLPKVHFGNNDMSRICRFHIGQPRIVYNEWVIYLHFSTHSDNLLNTLRVFRSYWKAIISGSLAGYIKIIPTGDTQKFPFKKKTRCQ